MTWFLGKLESTQVNTTVDEDNTIGEKQNIKIGVILDPVLAVFNL